MFGGEYGIYNVCCLSPAYMNTIGHGSIFLHPTKLCLHRLTAEDRARIKQEFKDSNFGKWLLTKEYLGYPPRTHIKILLSICCALAFFDVGISGIVFAYKDTPIVQQSGLSILFLFCNTWLGNCVATSYPTTGTDFFSNLMLWHLDSHHYLDILAFSIFYYILAIKVRSLIYPALIVGTIIGVSEYSWWWSYVVAHWQLIFIYNRWELTYFSNSIGLVYGILIFLYYMIIGINKRFMLWVVVNYLFFIGWIYIGFPITYDFNGVTQYLNNVQVNTIEVVHWYWAFITFIIIVPAKVWHRII